MFKSSKSRENLKPRKVDPTSPSPSIATATTYSSTPHAVSSSTVGLTDASTVSKQTSPKDQTDLGRISPTSPSRPRPSRNTSRLLGAFRKKDRKDSSDNGDVLKTLTGSAGEGAGEDTATSNLTPSISTEQLPTVKASSSSVASSPKLSAAVLDSISEFENSQRPQPTSSSSFSSRLRLDSSSKSSNLPKSTSAQSPLESPSSTNSPQARPPLPSTASGFSLRSFRKKTKDFTDESKPLDSPEATQTATSRPSSRPQSRRTSMLSLDEFTTPLEELPPGTPTTPLSMSVSQFRAAARARMASEDPEESTSGTGSRSRRASMLLESPSETGEKSVSKEGFKDYSPISPGVFAARSRAEELAQLEAQMKSTRRGMLSRMMSEDSVTSSGSASGTGTPNNRQGMVEERIGNEVPKLRHASSLARLSNLPNESALADDEEGPPPIPKKSRARQSSSPIDSYFPPVVTTGHSSSASFSGTSQSATIANGRPRTNTSASASQPRGTLSKKNSSSSLGYHGHLKAVRAAAEASAASYDRIHGTQTPPDAFRENKVEKEEEPDRSQATSAPKVSTGRGADSARILASFGKKGGTGPVPQTLLDALTKLESDRAVRSPNLFATKQASSVWGVATPESESTDDDLPLPSLPWMSSANPRPRSSSSSRRVASEGSAPGDTWRPSDQAPQDPESSMKEAAVVDTPLAEPGASEKEPTSPRATRIPLSARLAKAVNSNSISRPTSPEVSRPSSPAQGRNHRRSLSAAQEEALVAKSQHAYALQLSNMLFPMAPEAIDQDAPETEKVSSTPASPSLNGLSSPKRSSVLLSKSLVH